MGVFSRKKKTSCSLELSSKRISGVLVNNFFKPKLTPIEEEMLSKLGQENMVVPRGLFSSFFCKDTPNVDTSLTAVFIRAF